MVESSSHSPSQLGYWTPSSHVADSSSSDYSSSPASTPLTSPATSPLRSCLKRSSSPSSNPTSTRVRFSSPDSLSLSPGPTLPLELIKEIKGEEHFYDQYLQDRLQDEGDEEDLRVFYSDGEPVLDFDEDELQPSEPRPRSFRDRPSTPHPSKPLLARLSTERASSPSSPGDGDSSSSPTPRTGDQQKHAQPRTVKATPATIKLGDHTISPSPAAATVPLLDRISPPGIAKKRRNRPRGRSGGVKKQAARRLAQEYAQEQEETANLDRRRRFAGG